MKIAIIAIFFVAAFSQVVRERVAAGPVLASAPVVERFAAPRVAAQTYGTQFVERVGAPVVAGTQVVERVGAYGTPVVAESVYGGYPYGAYGAYPYETYGAYGATPYGAYGASPYGAYGAYPYAYGQQLVVP